MKRRTFVGSTVAAAATIPMRSLFAAELHGQSDVDAITLDGKEFTLSGQAVSELASRLRGQLLLAGDDGYDDARRILEPSFDKHPALIAQVTGTADIRTAVEFAAEHQLLLAVKCGGHSAAGKSTCDGGMMIDLSPFRNVRVDPVAQRAWVTGGSLLGAVDHETMAYNLVVPMGTVSHTGVGGLVTGGGFGRLARRFGMSIDHLTGVQIVTADGTLLRANEEENPDLFWGVRGGGGNFGIVTSFEFRLHSMQRRVVGGRIFFPLDRARAILEWCAENVATLPDELAFDFSMDTVPGGKPGRVGFGMCYSGPENRADAVFAPIRRLGKAVVDDIKAIDYVDLQRSGDKIDLVRGGRAPAVARYLKSGFFSEIKPGMIDAIINVVNGNSDPKRGVHMAWQQSGGAIARVPGTATAFAQRNAIGNFIMGVIWPAADDSAPHLKWGREMWPQIEPFIDGYYVNDGETNTNVSSVDSPYRENYPRLVQVKNRYDRHNLFRLNANVEPTI